MDLQRIARHLLTTALSVHKRFPPQTRRVIEQAIAAGEARHSGEIRFAVEATLDMRSLLQGKTAHERALEVFSLLGVWDTEANTGVLIYVLLADRQVEIVADRGIHRRVDSAEWQAVCRRMVEAFRQGDFETGSVQGVRAVSILLERHFPAPPVNPNELPNRVELL
ncbi:MAG TPA: TPM domain-containing protein [Candidatus Competibacteraceae bacterium]|nr:TPM domain-containing protein [Candidatus Competibacteraceae bacterium]